MKLHQLKAFVKASRTRCLMVLMIALATAAIYAGCANQEKTPPSNVNKGTTNATPQVAPNTGTNAESMGETPIVISGGSVNIDFSNETFKRCDVTAPPTACPSPVSGDYIFWADGNITDVYVDDDDNEAATPSPVPLPMPSPSPSPQNTVITVQCSKGAAEVANILVINDYVNKRVYIEFNETTKFKPHRPNSRRRTAKKYKIDSLKVNGTDFPIPAKATIEFVSR